MDDVLKSYVWHQYGAALDTLEDALNLCPDHLWTAVLWKDDEDPRYGTFWFIAAHTLTWTDLFLTSNYQDFKPPAPFVRGRLPDQPYTKADVMAYFADIRQRSQSIIEGLTEEKAYSPLPFEWIKTSYLEMQLYAMRHIQEHAAQLNFYLGQQGVTGQDWVAQAREKTA